MLLVDYPEVIREKLRDLLGPLALELLIKYDRGVGSRSNDLMLLVHYPLDGEYLTITTKASAI